MRDVVLTAIAIGVAATLMMDAWNLMLKRAFGIPSLNYCLLGRWLRHMQEGKFRHASIATAEPRSRECTIGWAAHYSIGISLAVMWMWFAPSGWLARPTLRPALVYGIVTIVFPFFVMQPSLGFGIASSKAPKPGAARLKSLATHTIFGVGLYLGALALGAIATPTRESAVP